MRKLTMFLILFSIASVLVLGYQGMERAVNRPRIELIGMDSNAVRDSQRATQESSLRLNKLQLILHLDSLNTAVSHKILVALNKQVAISIQETALIYINSLTIIYLIVFSGNLVVLIRARAI